MEPGSVRHQRFDLDVHRSVIFRTPGPFPELWRRPGLRWADIIVGLALLGLLFGLLKLAPALNAPFLPKTAPSAVSTDPADLPYYAVRSLLRMFIALILSVIFTFVYATAAARLRRTEKVLIPLLDILQSAPVLGFLSVTVTAFIECASIFAIFTAMAWNMTFALLPWLTVQQNVELGLEARGISEAERAERALAAIDTIGLDGFESAYPKELSGEICEPRC